MSEEQEEMRDELGESINKQVRESIKNPYNELELQYATLQSAWGREYSGELYAKVQRSIQEAEYVLDEKTGQIMLVKIDKEPIIQLHEIFTRDLRLGNLSDLFGEVEKCQEWLLIANDCLHNNLFESYMLSMARVISILEISQSRSGFLRKRLGTIRTENIKSDVTPSKNRFLGGKKEDAIL